MREEGGKELTEAEEDFRFIERVLEAGETVVVTTSTKIIIRHDNVELGSAVYVPRKQRQPKRGR